MLATRSLLDTFHNLPTFVTPYSLCSFLAPTRNSRKANVRQSVSQSSSSLSRALKFSAVSQLSLSCLSIVSQQSLCSLSAVSPLSLLSHIVGAQNTLSCFQNLMGLSLCRHVGQANILTNQSQAKLLTEPIKQHRKKYLKNLLYVKSQL